MAAAAHMHDVPIPDASIESVLNSLDDWPACASEAADSVRAAFAFAVTPTRWLEPNNGPNEREFLDILNEAKLSAHTALQKVLDVDLGDTTTDWRRLTFPVMLVLSIVQICTTNALATFDLPKTEGKPPHEEVSTPHPQLQASCQALLEVEIDASIGASPVGVAAPFVDAFGQWLSHVLTASFKMHEIAIAKAAWRKATFEGFKAYFRGDSREAAALRDFLVAGDDEQPERLREIGTLRTLETALNTWTEAVDATNRGRQDAWKRHLDQLKSLPDSQGTMFNESFGVRKVFQPPLVRYHINGRRSAMKAESIADIGGLFGALVSNRISSQDLVVVSGGPGSGKSTLCRVLASRIAALPGMHPVFLKLRKAKDGSDIMLFVEESLKEKGLIDRIADLWSIPNLVLILDGFDELAMSSRSRLRRFFNILREELREGPLGPARVIVSGRDTLFPGGEGLPTGSHIVALQPFDKDRVAAWGAMWRRQHKSGPGHIFRPETLIKDTTSESPAEHPLTHLVRWPLTLHLIAQIHAAGKLTVSSEQEIEKAYLYRSILKETAARQEEQVDGEGRMDAARLRRFLRALAWEMYLRQTDSMDPVDVEPLLLELHGDEPETARAEFAEVAIVNAPELTKGDETGFEFVHKSFSEFLIAEHLASLVEQVIFKVAEWDSGELTWRMDENAAAGLLSPALALRPLPQEVQEMLEPMLGVLAAFSRGDDVGDDIDPAQRQDGLLRIIERFERLYAIHAGGHALETVILKGREQSPPNNPLEAYAHYGLGIALIGTASARRLKLATGGQAARYFRLENGTGLLTRYLSILQAGGIVIDRSTAFRLLNGGTVLSETTPMQLHEAHFPVITRYFHFLDGYSATIPRAAFAGLLEMVVASIESVASDAIVKLSGVLEFDDESAASGPAFRWEDDSPFGEMNDLRSRELFGLVETLQYVGLIDTRTSMDFERISRDFRDVQERIRYLSRRHRDDPDILSYMRRLFRELRTFLLRLASSLGYGSDFRYRSEREYRYRSEREYRNRSEREYRNRSEHEYRNRSEHEYRMPQSFESTMIRVERCLRWIDSRLATQRMTDRNQPGSSGSDPRRGLII